MTLIEAIAIWRIFKEELEFVCKDELYLDMSTHRSKELREAILLLEDHYMSIIRKGGENIDKNNLDNRM